MLLKPYETVVDMSERHLDGIAASCRSENRSALGSSREGTASRVIQRRAYGSCDEEYPRLKAPDAGSAADRCAPRCRPRAPLWLDVGVSGTESGALARCVLANNPCAMVRDRDYAVFSSAVSRCALSVDPSRRGDAANSRATGRQPR